MEHALPLDTLWLTLAVSVGVQAIFFAFAASLRTDKVTDLSYSLTFVLLASFLLWRNGDGGTAPRVLAAMVIAWGVRLGVYLLYRIVRMGRDARFDGIRERFWSFAKFWLLQGTAVWAIMLPVTLWFAGPGDWGWTKAAGAAIWLIGLVVETVADLQKFRHKSRPGGGASWIETGLWRYSRHPNYFGELLCWWGVFVFVSADLGWLIWLGLFGPVAITLVLLFATGVPQLERNAERKFGAQPGYQAYRRRTSLIVPWPPRRL
jgi:steroid 5-alpha reductase family enzyme